MTGVSEPPAAVVMGRDYLDNPKPSTTKMDFSKIILRSPCRVADAQHPRLSVGIAIFLLR